MPQSRRRALVSAFLVFHLAATGAWNLGPDAVRVPFWWYILPLGLWQNWSMFAPEPFRESPTLEAEVIDARGGRHRFDFPSQAGRSPWHSIASFRHPKYAHEAMNSPDPGYRDFAARYVVRRLGLPSSSYPVEVQLRHRVRPIPPPGSPGPRPAELIARGTYRFGRPVEAAP